MKGKRAHTDDTRALIGWDGIRFTVPGDWNVTGVSAERAEGYLKVDSPGTMFVQVKWSDPSHAAPRTLMEIVARGARLLRRGLPTEPGAPDLRRMLDAYLKETEKRARRSGQTFNCKVKPESNEGDGERTAHNFSWAGGGQGQGKIWFCSTCRRTVIAQVVGQGRDPVADVAAGVFGEMHDHGDGGWNAWGAFDLVASVPAAYALRAHKFMSGYLRMEFWCRSRGRLVLERWGLANLARKKFTLREWLGRMAEADRHRPEYTDETMNGHSGVRARGHVRGVVARLAAVRDALPALRPALEYEACVWECEDTNKLYALQSWRPRGEPTLMSDLVARCECH
jgi:hypothetical protein